MRILARAVSLACALCFWSSSLVADTVKLADRTAVKVAIMETLTSGQGKPNDEVAFELREDILGPNRELLIAKGTPAYGHIIRTKRRGIFGRSGKLDFSCDYVKAVDGTRVPLRGTQIQSGRGNGGAVVATALIVSVLGVFINGRDVSVKKGTEFTVYVDQDTQIAVLPAAQPVTAVAGSTSYTIAIDPKVCQDLVGQLATCIGKLAQDTTVSIAVMDFELVPEKETMRMDAVVAKNVRDDLQTQLLALKGCRLIEHSKLEQAVLDLKLDASKPLDADAIKRFGASVGADYVLVGSISDRGKLVVINARLVSSATGEPACSASASADKP